MIAKMKYLPFLFLALFSFGVFGCGGSGGGGDSFSGAGNVLVSIQPNTIDVGDRTRVTVRISQVNPDGILLKVKFPDGLSYVGDTAFLIIGSDEIDIGPDLNVSGDGDDQFLVFFFEQDDFSENFEGVVQFELVGVDKVVAGEVEVDIDVDVPTVDNPGEFDPFNPAFQAEDSDMVVVED